MKRSKYLPLATLALCLTSALATAQSKVKVFILAGQSNMQGHGRISLKKDGDLDYAAKLPEFNYLKSNDKWAERKDVWYFHKNGKGDITKCNLKVGLGANNKSIGPELAFGHIVGEHFDEQVLLIKTAWGGQALAQTFRPPSSKLPPQEVLEAMLNKSNRKKAPKKKRNRKNRGNKKNGGNRKKGGRKKGGQKQGDQKQGSQAKDQQDKVKPAATAPKTSMDDVKARFGSKYRQMLAEVQMVLGHLKTHFPAYKGQGYEIAGVFWHQGWNDGCNKAFAAEYEKNMINFIADVRKDLGAPKLPFVIATSGMGGPGAKGVAGFLAKGIEPKQMAAAEKTERCVAVATREFQKHKPGRQKSHWHNSAESYCRVGDAAAKALLGILSEK